MDKYEIVIGLEIHAELCTESKLFCNCAYTFGASANDCTCPICLGMPGTLPVINRRALEFAVRAGLAMNCEITSYSKFDRKNYFYPDLPKNYQISQYDLPLCEGGKVTFEFINGESERVEKTVRLRRIHLEEDAGKSIHAEVTNDPTRSFMDFNRAGVPLMEIVSEPEIHSPEEAVAYCRAVKEILEYIEVSKCNMEEGSLRCEPNISLRPKGSQELGTRTEIKNMNSFQFLLAAMKYEVTRQARILDSGREVVQETMLFDENTGKTVAMRGKEEADDYRYFPEPDLVHVQIDDEWKRAVKSDLPELPADRRKRFEGEFGILDHDAKLLTEKRDLADFFDETTKKLAVFFDEATIETKERNSELTTCVKSCVNWIIGDLRTLLKAAKIDIQDSKITPEHLVDLILYLEGKKDRKLEGPNAKVVLNDAFETGKMPEQIAKEKDLFAITDDSIIESAVSEVLEEHKDGAVKDYRNGKQEAIGFLIGQVMRATRGKANPQRVNQFLREKLSD